MTAQEIQTTVLVIGGGPAGSTTAAMLARQGLEVTLLERERFPRDHVGESLLPASMPVLEELGVLGAVQEAGFVPKFGATMSWGRDRAPWSWYFGETNAKYPHSYQVWRPRFDHILLENARTLGVDVRQGHRVSEVVWDGQRAAGVRFQTTDGHAGSIRAGFVVDASGQAGLLSRSLDLRRWDSFFQNLAVYGYFTGAQRLPSPDDGNIFIESYEHGWLWIIPLNDGWSSVGVVADRETGQRLIGQQGIKGFFDSQIAQASHTAGLLVGADLASGPFIAKDWSYVCDRLAGDGYVLAGDAACFVDPLFSSGVHLALMSGVLAAAYVKSALTDPSITEAAGRAYQELYLREYSHFREMAKLFYSSNLTSDSYFWEARRILDTGDAFSPRQAFIQAVAGQPPRGYERAVLEHGQAPKSFASSVQQVEADRAQRSSRWSDAISTVQGQQQLFSAVPRLAKGASMQRKPVLGAGEFVWGYTLITNSQPEGTPCSGLVAQLVSRIDGAATVGQLMTQLGALGEADGIEDLQRSVLAALQILYVDGTVDELAGL